jgi:chemotaxis protein MotB
MSKRRRRMHEEHEEHIDESWLVPYADILTLLLALFIILYASSSIDQEKYQAIMETFQSEFTGTSNPDKQEGLTTAPLPPDQQQVVPPKKEEKEDKTDAGLDELKQKLEKYINANKLNAVVTLEDTLRGVEVSIKDVVFFDSGSAVLKEHSFKTLNGIVGLINTVPNSISIEGHTDNEPIHTSTFRSNWELSAARAASVLHYFDKKNVDPKRMQFTGYGEYQPLVPNNTVKNQQANRRVTIVILRK